MEGNFFLFHVSHLIVLSFWFEIKLIVFRVLSRKRKLNQNSHLFESGGDGSDLYGGGGGYFLLIT